MPTARARHMITETDEIGRAIDRAARRWPEAGSRAEVLRLLILDADAAAQQAAQARSERVRGALERLARIGTANPPGWREALRDEWPE